MRRTLVAALLALVCMYASVARAVEACGAYDGGSTWIEWSDGAEPRGVRLIVSDNRWRFEPRHEGVAVFCDSCPGSVFIGGFVRLNVAPAPRGTHDELVAGGLGINDARSFAEWALHPRFVSSLFWSLNHAEVTFESASEPQPARVFGLDGRARVLLPNIKQRHVIAFASEQRCFSIIGLFPSKEGTSVSVDDLSSFEPVIALERYTPQPRPPRLPPPAAERSFPKWNDFPLGDARRKLQQDQR